MLSVTTASPGLLERQPTFGEGDVPLCKLVAEAGWDPVTRARCTGERVYVERFGKYLTVLNDSDQSRTVTLACDDVESGSTRELVGGGSLDWRDHRTTLTLDAERVALLQLGPN